MKCRIRKGMLILELPLIVPARRSKTGKTLVVAHCGPRRTSLRVNKKPVIVTANAYIRPDEYVKGTEGPRRKTARGHRQTQRKSKPKARAPLVEHRKR